MSSLTARAAAAALIDRARDVGVPASVTFQLTDRCNYRCAHCYEVHDESDELSTDEVKRVLRELAAAGVLFITLTGGEVFLRRDLNKILVEARRLRFAVRLYTTGHFIDEARAARLKELALQEVHLSLYGPDAEAHETVTRMPGSFNRTIGAARRLRALGMRVILKSPVMTVNVRRYAAFRALVDSLGCRYKMDPGLTVREDGERSPLHLRPSSDDLLEFLDDVGDELLTAIETRARQATPGTRAHSPCGIGQTNCSINPQGLVFGCTSLPVPVGDLRRQSFLDVWRGSEKLHELRDLRWDDIAVCRECDLRPYCSRCHAMALLEDGNLRGPSKEACRLAVTKRELLRRKGLLPEGASDALPVPLRAEAPAVRHIAEKLAYGYRPAALRIVD